MTLPANDAFTLGFTGSHDSRRPSYHLSLRSTSPKIPFVSGHTKVSSVYSSHRRTSKARQSMSNDDSNAPVSDFNHEFEAFGCGGDEVSHKAAQLRHSLEPPSRVNSAAIEWEIPRKILHSSIGFLTLYLYISHGSPRSVVVLLSTALAIIIPADVLRLSFPKFERIYERCLGFLMRESEKKSSNGVIWYILGVVSVLSLYPLDVAVVAILILSWADTAASTFGRLWGRYTPPLPRRLPVLRLPLAPRKSLAGFIAGSLTGAIVTVGFWGWLGPLGADKPIWQWHNGVSTLEGATNWNLGGWSGLGAIGIVGGLVSGVAEALDLGSLDDNLTLPIISGGCIWGFFKCLQYITSS